MFTRRFWSLLIGSALLLVGLFLVIAGLNLEGVPDDTVQTGLVSGAIGLIWVGCEHLWPTDPRKQGSRPTDLLRPQRL